MCRPRAPREEAGGGGRVTGWQIASVSWGKDSTAMLHLLIDQGMPLDEVVFYDTGAEFPAIYRERDRTLPLLAENVIKYTELRPQRPFFYDMLAKPVHKRDGSIQRGYGWCGGPARWGTSEKTRARVDAHRGGGGMEAIPLQGEHVQDAHRWHGRGGAQALLQAQQGGATRPTCRCPRLQTPPSARGSAT